MYSQNLILLFSGHFASCDALLFSYLCSCALCAQLSLLYSSVKAFWNTTMTLLWELICVQSESDIAVFWAFCKQ